MTRKNKIILVLFIYLFITVTYCFDLQLLITVTGKAAGYMYNFSIDYFIVSFSMLYAVFFYWRVKEIRKRGEGNEL